MNKITKSGRALNKNEKILLTVLFLVSVLFLYYTIFLGPSLEKLSPLKTEVQKLKDQLKDTGNLSSTIKEREEELSKLKVEYDDATKAMPKGDRYPELSKELKEKAKGKGLSVINITYSKPEVYKTNAEEVSSDSSNTEKSTEKEGLLQYNVTLSLTGDFNNAVSFVGALEDDKRIMQVEQITASKEKIDIVLNYIVASSVDEDEYNFNNGSYGKNSLFE